jgi:hypothetical protein
MSFRRSAPTVVDRSLGSNITSHLSKEEYLAVTAAAEAAGVSTSRFVREIVLNHLKEYPRGASGTARKAPSVEAVAGAPVMTET